MRFSTLTLLLALSLTANSGCDSGPTQPSGKAQAELQEAGQKQAEDDEKQNQAAGQKMTNAKKK